MTRKKDLSIRQHHEPRSKGDDGVGEFTVPFIAGKRIPEPPFFIENAAAFDLDETAAALRDGRHKNEGLSIRSPVKSAGDTGGDDERSGRFQ